jgi:hypothetical protein
LQNIQPEKNFTTEDTKDTEVFSVSKLENFSIISNFNKTYSLILSFNCQIFLTSVSSEYSVVKFFYLSGMVPITEAENPGVWRSFHSNKVELGIDFLNRVPDSNHSFHVEIQMQFKIPGHCGKKSSDVE